MIEIILIILGIIIGLALSIKIVRPTERGLIEKMGKYQRFANPGLHIVIPFVEQIITVNTTERMVDAEKQEVITKDNLNADVDAQVYFKVKLDEESVKKSVYNVDDFTRQIVALTRTTLRDIIGTLSFKDVNSERSKINNQLALSLEKEADNWGIQIVRAELKEIKPPADVQHTMNSVLIAENEKNAAIDFATAAETRADGEKRAAIRKAEGLKASNILVAQGEAESIKIVNEAAEKYFRGQAVELKKLETLERTLSNNSKFVVSSSEPLLEMVSKLMMLSQLNKPVKEVGKNAN